MARVKGGPVTRKRRKRVLKQAKGYYGAKSKLYRTANEQLMNSLQYAYRDRRTKKRYVRALWIIRINAALKLHNLSYSKFINGLKKANIDINRKMLSELSLHDSVGFSKIVESAKKSLNIPVIKSEIKSDDSSSKIKNNIEKKKQVIKKNDSKIESKEKNKV